MRAGMNGPALRARQAAEKAMKALHLYHNQEAWGHVVRRLVEEARPRIDRSFFRVVKGMCLKILSL
jgi:HEPN domain-containing protein